jgi:uncharacterized protein YjiS (DUF1127 family)
MSITSIPFVRPDKPSWSVVHPGAWAPFTRLLSILSLWMARAQDRNALADLAEDKHRIADIGLTREQALREAGKPFWK